MDIIVSQPFRVSVKAASANTAEVLQEWLGMDASEISALTGDKIVGPQMP